MPGKLLRMYLLDELARTDFDPAPLAQVQALIEQQQAKVVEADNKLTRLHTVVAEKDFKIKALTFELAYYKRVRFGKASEALVGEQRLLFDETVDMDLAAIDEELRNQASTKPPRQRAGRQPLPPGLPRIEHRHEPESCQRGQCGADLVKIGEDISEQLDVKPVRFFVHRHIRPQYACRPCETITAAPIQAAVIDGGMAAVGLLAWIAACKYLDHLPAVPNRTDRPTPGRAVGPLDLGRLDRTHRRGPAATGRPAGRTAETTYLPACG